MKLKEDIPTGMLKRHIQACHLGDENGLGEGQERRAQMKAGWWAACLENAVQSSDPSSVTRHVPSTRSSASASNGFLVKDGVWWITDAH